MPALLMRANRPNSGEWYWTCGIATVENSPSRTPTSCRMRKRLVVERDGARLGEDLGRLVDRQHANAVAAEQIRQRGAHRPEADDQHVGVVSRTPPAPAPFRMHPKTTVRHAPPFMPVITVVCSPRSIAPSSVRIEALMRSPGRRYAGFFAALADEHLPLGGFAQKMPDDEHRQLARRAQPRSPPACR